MAQNQNFEPTLSPENEYREALKNKVLTASEGSVGIYTSMDLGGDTTIATKIAERNPNGAKNIPDARHGGWADYGENKLESSDWNPNKDSALNPSAYGFTGEKVNFVQGEETTKVLYTFSDFDYTDSTGRPGNALNIGFELPNDVALDVKEAVKLDPSYIVELAKAQAVALGVTEEQWRMNMAPRIGQFGAKSNDPDRAVVINSFNGQGETESSQTTYGEKKDILVDRPEIVTAESVYAATFNEILTHELNRIDIIRANPFMTNDEMVDSFDEEIKGRKVVLLAETDPLKRAEFEASIAAESAAKAKFLEGMNQSGEVAERDETKQAQLEDARSSVDAAFAQLETPNATESIETTDLKSSVYMETESEVDAIFADKNLSWSEQLGKVNQMKQETNDILDFYNDRPLSPDEEDSKQVAMQMLQAYSDAFKKSRA